MLPRLETGPTPGFTVEGHDVTELRCWHLAAAAPGAVPSWDDAISAGAPGTVAEALTDAGRETTDVDERDWWYRCATAIPDVEPGEEPVLRFAGLATHATVRVDGTRFDRDGMFSPCAVVLAAESAPTEVELVFHALGPRLRARHPRPRWKTRIVGEQSLRWYRTQLLGRCPGFAPGPPVVGPWRPVVHERRRRVAVEALRLRPSLDESGTCLLRVHVRLRGLDTEVRRVECTVGGLSAALELRSAGGHVAAEGTVRGRLDPWWPHTHGTPALHDVHLLVETAEGPVRVDAGPVGFRRLVVRDPDRFAIEVNGVPVFCRGGSLMPHPLGVDADAGREERLLARTVAAGMNMVRLPGVAHYAHDRLLRRADALGLLVWQDFPFANMDYPVDDDRFRALVLEEAGSFLEGAAAHPSLAVLCGGSEIEQQVAMLGLEATFPLLDEVLPGALDAADVAAPYVRSTPTGGSLPFRTSTGVAHYFGVGAYRRPLADARHAAVRFAVECLAFANVPGDEALARMGKDGAGAATTTEWADATPRDHGAEWDFGDVRDHYLHALTGLDPGELRSADADRYLRLSRLVTGEVIAATLGEWRRADSTCRGALLWTLNDMRPGPGFGILDEVGEPKPAYWYARRALTPVAVWLVDEGLNGLDVHVSNDRPEPLTATLGVAQLRVDGTVLLEGERPALLPPHGSLHASAEEILGRFADVSGAYAFGPPTADLVVAELWAGGALISRAVHAPRGLLRLADDRDPGLRATTRTSAAGIVRLDVSADSLAVGVAVEAPGLDASDWSFTLPGGRSTTIELTPRDGVRRPEEIVLRPLGAGELRLPLEGP